MTEQEKQRLRNHIDTCFSAECWCSSFESVLDALDERDKENQRLRKALEQIVERWQTDDPWEIARKALAGEESK